MEYAVIEVFTNEDAHHGITPVHRAVMDVVRRHGVAVRLHSYRGIAGVYEGGDLSSPGLADTAPDLPVKIEIIVATAGVSALVDAIADVVTEGLVTVRSLGVYRHRSYPGLIPRSLRVVDVMTPDPVSVTPDTSVLEVVRLLMDHPLSDLPVADGERRVVGIITEEDLIMRAGLPVRPGVLVSLGVDPPLSDPEFQHLRNLTVRQVMTALAQTVQAGSSVFQAVVKMTTRHLRALPVLDGEELVGMITRLDALTAAARRRHELKEWEQPNLMLEGPRLTGDAIKAHGRYVQADDSILDVGQLVLGEGSPGLAVVDDVGMLVGVISERDLIQALLPETAGLRDYLIRRLPPAQLMDRHPSLSLLVRSQTAADIMRTSFLVGRVGEPLGDAILRVVSDGLEQLPVVDDSGRFLGFLSRHDLLRAIVYAENLPPETASGWVETA